MPTASDLTLCRSALWEALALGFRLPTAETLRRLASDEGVGALADVAAALDADGGTELASRVLRLGAARPGRLPDLEQSFRRLFGHTARGAVPPYETEYGEDSLFLPAQEMSDLAAFYRAFGLALAPTAHERMDHIACECEFLLVLARKEAYALERNDPAVLEATRQASRLFLQDHLSRWAPAFALKLQREDRQGFYRALGELCHAFVLSECEQHSVPVGPDVLRLRSPVPADVPMACGSSPDLLRARA